MQDHFPDRFAVDMRKVQELETRRLQDPQATLLLIQIYDQILKRLRPNETPSFYAFICNNLGDAYAKLSIQDKATNLGRAITSYYQALLVWTPETAPFEYAEVQNSLGLAYLQLPTGDATDNLKRAITCFQEALRFWKPEMKPFDYARAQNGLGMAYWKLPTGDKAANLERAIDCYRNALHFWTRKNAPDEYATVQNGLGLAYWKLPTGDRSTNLTRAIACYQEALLVWTLKATPHEYAATQNNLGVVYLHMPTGDPMANLNRAITHFKDALRVWTSETAPFDYAMTQTNLGLAYWRLPTGDRGTNLTRAMACYQKALLVWTPETAPFEYANAQMSLGLAYYNLPTGDKKNNLNQAIECYQQALHIWTLDAAPFEYATVQTNLGNTYIELPTGDRSSNLIRAIACYQEALHIWTPETAPLDHAMILNNLGFVYSQLPIGDRMTNLTKAIGFFQKVLHFRTPETAPFEYAVTQTNLGIVYSQLPTGDKTDNLTRAIACYQQALRFYSPEGTPFEYANIQNHLGNAYSQLSTDKMANLTQAITYYQEALRFWTPGTTPLEYAKVQNNLGFAFSQLPTDKINNMARAITCYQQALRLWTLENMPIEYRRTNSNLADLYFAQGEWDAALVAYLAAIDAGDQLYQAGLSAEGKLTEVAENASIYHLAAFTAVLCGETAKALLILERGKTWLLAEALHLRVSRPANVPDEIWAMFEHAGTDVRTVQSMEVATPAGERDPIHANAVREQIARTANAALEAAVEQVRVYDPSFLKAIDLPAVQTLLPDEHTVLVAFCITEHGTIGFVMSRSDEQNVQVTEVQPYTQADLSRLFVELDTDKRPVGGWLGDYYRYLTEDTSATFAAWQGTITSTLAELGQHLLTPILSLLPPSTEHIIFLPSAELFLLPLHAVQLSGTDGELLCDRYQVSYAPSIEVLADTRARVKSGVLPELYAVINPEEDPKFLFTSTEGTSIAARLFPQYTLDMGRTGTKERVFAGAQGRTYVHFSCHGSYNWNDPPDSGFDLADGRLTLAELQRGTLDLSVARLVTLSACETGISDVLRGSAEEYVGIPAGFLLAGAPCVVSSLWAVPDLSTALLMERFYRNHLNRGMEFAAALREAQVWVRDLRAETVAEYAAQCYRQSHWRDKSGCSTPGVTIVIWPNKIPPCALLHIPTIGQHSR